MNKQIILGLMFILCLNIASASILDVKNPIDISKKSYIDVGNVKLNYHILWETYPPIEIKGLLGLGDAKFMGAIVEHTNYCSNNCEDIINIHIADDSPLVDNIRFYRIMDDGSRILANIRSYQLYVQDEKGEWKQYNIGEVMKAGDYILKLNGDKRPEWTYDWQIETQGKWIDEWSIWGGETYSTISGWTGEDNSDTYTAETGVFFMVNQDSYLYNVTKFPTATPTRTILRNSTGSILTTINIVGNTSNFNGYLIQGGKNYTLTTDNNGASYNRKGKFFGASYPVLGTGINVTHGYDGGLFDGGYNGVNSIQIKYYSYSNIILNSPADNYASTSNTVTFSANAIVVGGATLVNISLWDNSTGTWKINKTIKNENYNCYQESANTSNQGGKDGSCGQDYTGSYNTTSVNLFNGNNIKYKLYDGIWSDYEIFGGASNFLINYKIPSNTNGAIWTYSQIGTDNNNYTIPTNCLVNNVTIKYTINTNTSGTRFVNISCYNHSLSDYTLFYNTSGKSPNLYYSFAEEGIYWNITTNVSKTTIFNNTYSNGANVLWGVQACDSDGACGLSENRSVSIDTTAPTISLLYPTGTIPIASVGQNISLNYSIVDSNIGSCWYNYNGTTNITIPCASNSSLILGTQKSIIMYANDSIGNLATNSFSWDYSIFENSRTYNASALETTSQSYILNTTINTTQWIAQSATFNYNNTVLLATKTMSGNNIIFSSSTGLPGVETDTSKNLYWTIQLTNSTGNYLFNTSISNQTITKTQFQKCSGAVNVTFVNFTIYDQQVPTTKLNTTFLASFNYWAGDGSIKSSYTYQETGTPTNSSFQFCLNPGSGTINIDANIQYGGVNNYAQNYFYYRNKALTNATTEQSLYLLNSSISTITTLRVIDPYQKGLVGYIGKIYKHDVGTNTDLLVGMFKTNYNGQDIAYLNWYDTLYKFVVYDTTATSIVYTAEPFKVSVTPQVFSIATTDTGIDWTKFGNVSYSLTINNNTRTFLLTFDDPTIHMTAGCLRIAKIDGGNITVLSDECAAGSSGTLTYTVNSGNGTYYGIFYGKGSAKSIDIVVFNFLDYTTDVYTQIGNMDGTILAMLVVMLTAFAGIFSPVAFIVMAMVGYIACMLLGFQSTNSGNFQIAFFSFLAIGGYLVWKLRT